MQLDFRFHLIVARTTRNTTVVQLMRVLLERLEIARDMTPRALHDAALEVAIHERTLRAIMSGDGKGSTRRSSTSPTWSGSARRRRVA